MHVQDVRPNAPRKLLSIRDSPISSMSPSPGTPSRLPPGGAACEKTPSRHALFGGAHRPLMRAWDVERLPPQRPLLREHRDRAQRILGCAAESNDRDVDYAHDRTASRSRAGGLHAITLRRNASNIVSATAARCDRARRPAW